MIGYKNSGGLIGLGLTPNGMFGYEFGFQISWKWFYFNAGYGVFDTKQNEKRPGHSFEETMEAFDAMAGVMIGFGPTRRVFIDAGIGHTFFGPQERVHGIKIDHNTFTGVIGIGIRIGNLAKYPEDEPTDADDTR